MYREDEENKEEEDIPMEPQVENKKEIEEDMFDELLSTEPMLNTTKGKI